MIIFFIGSFKEKPTTGGHLYNLKIIDAITEMKHVVSIINVHRLPQIFKYRLLSFVYAFLLLIRNKPDLIIQVSDSALRYICFSMFTELINIPTIQMVHHIHEHVSKFSFRTKLNMFFIKHNLRRSKRIIVNSHYTKLEVIKFVDSGSERKIIIINPGIDIDYTRKNKRIYKNKKFWNLISVGAVSERKGYHYLIDALQNLKNIPFRYYIIGNIEDKEYYSSLLEKIKNYCLEERVIFTGFKADVQLFNLYNNSDLFILSSLHEGYGIVLCEAICHGLPIIATDVGAVSEIIEDKKTGFLIKPSSSECIEKALRKIFSEPELAQDMSQNAIKRCEHLNSWSKMKEDVKEVIKEMLGV